MQDFGRIGVLMGGYSSERDISLTSGQAVYEELKNVGYDVIVVDIDQVESSKVKEIIEKANINVAFIALHGLLGEDGHVQSILEELGIAYTGSGVIASERAFNKHQTHQILDQENITTPKYKAFIEYDHFEVDSFIEEIGFPVVVKPTTEGSSIGVSIVDNKTELDLAIKAAFGYGNEILIEKYVSGKELTVSILGEQALPVIEIKHKAKYFDFYSKYEDKQTEYCIPANLELTVAHQVQRIALEVFHALGCQDFARIDFILGDDQLVYVIEVNTIPGFTNKSLLPKAAKKVGINFLTLCEQIITLAYAKKKKN